MLPLYCFQLNMFQLPNIFFFYSWLEEFEKKKKLGLVRAEHSSSDRVSNRKKMSYKSFEAAMSDTEMHLRF